MKKIFLSILLLLCGTPVVHAQFQEALNLRFKGAGWFKFGQIVNSTDTILGGSGFNNYNGSWLQETGCVFNGIVAFNEMLEGSFGIGIIRNHKPGGQFKKAESFKLNTRSFVNMARLTYTRERKTVALKINAGLFSYKYDNNIKNLGLYLIRGSVYPQILFSGFEAKEMLPIANMLGGHVRLRVGKNWVNDILLVGETDMAPKYDYSLLYITGYQFGPALEIGGGVNFYHLLPVYTPPYEDNKIAQYSRYTKTGQPPDTLDYHYRVMVGPDTVKPTMRGIKLMGRFALDLKPLLGLTTANSNHLVLYGEAAVLGIKNYPHIYENISERVPMMAGFTIPTGNLLNILALEVEYFGSKHVPDYRKVMSHASPVPLSPYTNRRQPAVNDPDSSRFEYTPYDGDADNLKWSLYFAKVFAGHMKISGQIACDHFRTGGTIEAGSNEEALTRLSDWYWMLKSTFFF